MFSVSQMLCPPKRGRSLQAEQSQEAFGAHGAVLPVLRMMVADGFNL